MKSRKFLALTLGIVLIMSGIIGGTMAWLTAESDTVENTFTSSNIGITLEETKPNNQTAKMVPGWDIEKNPSVKVMANSEACYLFVRIEESNNFSKFMTYEVADGWTSIDDGDNNRLTSVYYRKMDATGTNASAAFQILKDDKVTVNTTVTKADMETLTPDTQPKLTFTAYATQRYEDEKLNEMDVTDAWSQVNPSN